MRRYSTPYLICLALLLVTAALPFLIASCAPVPSRAASSSETSAYSRPEEEKPVEHRYYLGTVVCWTYHESISCVRMN